MIILRFREIMFLIGVIGASSFIIGSNIDLKALWAEREARQKQSQPVPAEPVAIAPTPVASTPVAPTPVDPEGEDVLYYYYNYESGEDDSDEDMVPAWVPRDSKVSPEDQAAIDAEGGVRATIPGGTLGSTMTDVERQAPLAISINGGVDITTKRFVLDVLGELNIFYNGLAWRVDLHDDPVELLPGTVPIQREQLSSLLEIIGLVEKDKLDDAENKVARMPKKLVAELLALAVQLGIDPTNTRYVKPLILRYMELHMEPGSGNYSENAIYDTVNVRYGRLMERYYDEQEA